MIHRLAILRQDVFVPGAARSAMSGVQSLTETIEHDSSRAKAFSCHSGPPDLKRAAPIPIGSPAATTGSVRWRNLDVMDRCPRSHL